MQSRAHVGSSLSLDRCIGIEADGRTAQSCVSAWKTEYNTERPHRSLGDRTPVEYAALAMEVSLIADSSSIPYYTRGAGHNESFALSIEVAAQRARRGRRRRDNASSARAAAARGRRGAPANPADRAARESCRRGGASSAGQCTWPCPVSSSRSSATARRLMGELSNHSGYDHQVAGLLDRASGYEMFIRRVQASGITLNEFVDTPMK